MRASGKNTAVKAVCADAIAKADVQVQGIQAMAEFIRDAMQRIHGGEWRIQIDHDARFVFITFR